MAEYADSEEDLKELEVQLYGQVHHEIVEPKLKCEKMVEESPDASSKATNTESSDKSSGNVVTNSSRYWAKIASPVVSQHRKFVKAGPENCSGTAERVQSPKKVDHAVSTTANQPHEPGATLSASRGGPEKNRSINPFSVSNRKKPGSKGTSRKNGGGPPGNFLDRKRRRLEQKKKLHQKRAKSQMARLKRKKSAETIVLDSSDEDDEDVIIIPLPPPPIVTVESSDEEAGECLAKQSDDVPEEANNSHCNSPNSIMSDDFIGQQDKTRLLSESAIPEDGDLQCPASEKSIGRGTADSNKRNKLAENFATPEKRVSRKQGKQGQSIYEVTQSNFRAADVYESESSDMPESIYEKGKHRAVDVANQLSDSDVEEIGAVAKTKRLRKRKASGSCKGSEPNDDSTDSDIADNLATALPYISRGEAVENCKARPRKRLPPNRDNINSDDREFIDKLSNIARGCDEKCYDGDELHESHNSPEASITAREIAEDVLRQANTRAAAPEIDNAIPSEAMADSDLLKVIDTLSTQLDDFQEPPRHGREPTPELFFEDLTNKESADNDSDVCEVEDEGRPELHMKRAKLRNKFDFMNVVFTNRDHVAWNEEMVRFYNFSWGQEKFNVDRMLRLMDRESNWYINNADRFPRERRFSNLKCHNCCEFGHQKITCPYPQKDLICFVCGDIGHKEPRCPNTICLRCGMQTNVFTRSCENCISENQLICPICRIRGHSIDLCPDKWRRYHNTTTINEHPNPQVFYNEKKFCCICAGRGHLPENCRSPNKLTEYHAPTSEIRYHSKTYADSVVKDTLPPGVIGVHLMCKPDEEMKFSFSDKVTKDSYHWRFQSAVGLLDPSSKILRSYVLNPFAKGDKTQLKIYTNNKDLENFDERNLNYQGESDDSIEIIDDANTVEIDDKNIKMSTKSSELVMVDTDSNYSFSEHFPQIENLGQEFVATSSRKQRTEPLPDFIPISDDHSTLDTEKKVHSEPDFIALNDSDDEEMSNVENCTDEIREGKIYLSKFHTNFLLSPFGKRYLVDIAKKYDIQTQMNWSAVGNILVIKGLAANQDKFHEEFIKQVKTASDNKNRKTLEQSQKLPRVRETLIKVLQTNILQLEKDLGNVHDIYKKMTYNKSHISKTSFKLAEKNRRTLNMILMGQAGLREGQMHLSILQDQLRKLVASRRNDQVPDHVREEIEKHYRYIFTSYEHNNYEQLIRQYTTLKKTNSLPDLKLDHKLLGGYKSIGKKGSSKTKTWEQRASSVYENFKERIKLDTLNIPKTDFGMSSRKREYQEQSTNQFEQHIPKKQFRQEPYKFDPNKTPPPPNLNIPPPPPKLNNIPPPPTCTMLPPSSRRSTPPPPVGRTVPPPPGYFMPPSSNQNMGKSFEKWKIPNQPNRKQKVFHQQQFFEKESFRVGEIAGSSSSNKMHEINRKRDEKAIVSLNQAKMSPKANGKDSKKSSAHWSKECMVILARCMRICDQQPIIQEKLNKLAARAAKNALSQNDFNTIKQIYFNLLSSRK